MVDLTDHTYHIFDKYKMTKWLCRKRALYHLKYSDRLFQKINDKKLYMNRLLLPVYLELAQEYNLKVEWLITEKCKKQKIHQDILSKFKSRNPDKLFIRSFEVKFTKNGNVF